MINTTATTTTKNPYSMFTKTDYTSNAQYLSSTYGTNTKYYDDIDLENAKKEKNKKRNKLLIFGSVGLLITGALISALAYNKIPTGKITKQFERLTSSAQEGAKELAEQSGNLFGKVKNLCTNFTTIKDAYWRKFQNKLQDIPILNTICKGCDAIDNIYSKTLIKNIDKKAGSILGKQKDEVLTKLFGEKGLNGAMEELNTVFKKGQAVDGLIGKGQTISKFANDVSSRCLRDTPLQAKYSTKTIHETIDTLKGIDENAKIKLKELMTEAFLPKAADIANGCAPTDIITSGVPVLGFGLALATADNKEERKDTLINIGIPLLPTCFMPVVGLKFPILNGFKGLIACLAVGQVFKGIVVSINKLSQKAKNKGAQEV